MEQYITHIPVEWLTLDEIDELRERVCQYGFAKLNVEDKTLTAIWEVGPDAAIADLWDLHKIAEEIDAYAPQSDAYVPKPERITEAVTV